MRSVVAIRLRRCRAGYVDMANSGGNALVAAVVDTTLDFVECCVHTVLHTRGIYPPQAFEERRLFGTAVWKARHDKINEYVRQVVFVNARPLVEQGLVDKFVLVTSTRGGLPIDHVTIRINHLKLAFGRLDAADADDTAAVSERAAAADQQQELEQAFKSILLKLQLLDTLMKKFSAEDESSWGLQVETKRIQGPMARRSPV